MTGYAALDLVRDGDGYVLGSAYSREFVAVPDIGGRVVRWLQAGLGVEESARRAAEVAGEPVDVAGFVAGLRAAGLLPADDAADAAPVVEVAVAPWKRRLGRTLYGPVGLGVQGLLTFAAGAGLALAPETRPAYTDALVSGVPLVSILVISVLNTAVGLAHEFAHVLAAWAIGVPSRVSISRRMVTLVYQTDLTRLWSRPRRLRVVPLLAGMLFNTSLIGVVALAELTVLRGTPVMPLARALVLLNVGGLAFQFLVFMRTDVYALFVVATGARNLWAAKGAAGRRLVGRASADDRRLLADLGPREERWARFYLCLYVPGALWTAWYFVALGVPALARLLTVSWAGIARHGLVSPLGAAGAVSLVFTAASSGFVLWGAGRAGVRLVRRLTAPR